MIIDIFPNSSNIFFSYRCPANYAEPRCDPFVRKYTDIKAYSLYYLWVKAYFVCFVKKRCISNPFVVAVISNWILKLTESFILVYSLTIWYVLIVYQTENVSKHYIIMENFGFR